MAVAKRLFLSVSKGVKDLSVVLTDLAVAMLPCVVLARRQPDSPQQDAHEDFGSVAPVPDVIDGLVTSIVRNPLTFQGSPLSFSDLMFSSINSPTDLVLREQFLSNWLI